MEQRLSQVAKENERFKYDNGTLRDDLSAKETAIGRTTHELEQVRLGLRKEHAENVRDSRTNQGAN